MSEVFDLAIVGGGIARGAAGRGLKALRVEKDDRAGAAKRRKDLGRAFGGDLTPAEVACLMAQEFAETAEGVVWRRAKSGLRMRASAVAALDGWMAARRPTEAAPTA